MDSKAPERPKTQKLKSSPGPEKTYNLLGQRLGRKGQETRERILTSALYLIESSPDTAITLSAVAREAAVQMPNLYRYFPDLGELILACLIRVVDSARVAYMDRLLRQWPDDTLQASVLDFLRAHYKFWHTHMRILHMRNSLADAGDARFLEYRRAVSWPIMEGLIMQMNGRPEESDSRCADLATVIMTAFERLATVMTNAMFHRYVKSAGIMDEPAYIERLMVAESEMIALAIKLQRASTAVVAKPRKH